MNGLELSAEAERQVGWDVMWAMLFLRLETMGHSIMSNWDILVSLG